MAYPRFQLARNFKTARRASTSLTLNSTSWANVDTALDLTLAAQVGDVLEATLNGLNGSEAVNTFLDAVTLVSAAPLNSFAKAGAVEASPGVQGVQSWFGVSGANTPIGAPAQYTVVSGDIVSGFVTVRLRYATGTATNKTLFASTNNPLTFKLENIGPPDPN